MKQYLKYALFCFTFAFAMPSVSQAQAPLDTTTGQYIDKTVPLPTGGEIVVGYGDPSWPLSAPGQTALATLLTLLFAYLSYFIKGWRNLNIEGSVKTIMVALGIGGSLLALKGQFTLQAILQLVPQLMLFSTLLYQLLKKAGLSTSAILAKFGVKN